MTIRSLILSNDADVRRALTATEWLVPIELPAGLPAGAWWNGCADSTGAFLPLMCVPVGPGHGDEVDIGAVGAIQPPYAVGDVVYVKEGGAFSYANHTAMANSSMTPAKFCALARREELEWYYRTDWGRGDPPAPGTPRRKRGNWIAASRMPKAVARIWRKVTAVEPVRIRDLTDDSLSRAGIFPCHLYTNVMRGTCAGREYLCALRDYLDEHHPDMWGLNKWVWRIEWRETEAR